MAKRKKKVREAVDVSGFSVITGNPTSGRSWAAVDKSKLPASAFLWAPDKEKKSTWKLPVYEGGGSIGEDGMYAQRGPINLNALRAASAAIAGSRTGQAMTIPADVRAKLTRLLRQHKIGPFAESAPAKTTELDESKQDREMLFPMTLREAFANKKVDRDNMVIKNVVLLGRHSLNNREYTEGCLERAIPKFEGIKSYLNHVKGDRDVRDSTGRYQGVKFEDDKLKGDWHLVKGPHAEMIMDMAERMPDLATNSIAAVGRYHSKEGKEIVEDIAHARSVDLVADGATTTTLFEGKESGKGNDNKGGKAMEYGDLNEQLLRTNRNDIAEAFIAEGVQSRDEEVTNLTKDKEAAITERDDLKGKLEGRDREVEVMKSLDESELPDEAKTDVFKGVLLAVREKKDGDKVTTIKEQVAALIEDRMKAFQAGSEDDDGVRDMGGEKKPLNEKKEEKKEGEEETDLVEAIKGPQLGTVAV